MPGLYRSFALLTVALIVGVADARAPQQIIGGTDAAPGEFPYQVALRLRGQHICGGALISERHIVTAAHCITGVVTRPYTELRIMTGSVWSIGGQSHTVKSVFSHPLYDTNNTSFPNDIAIIVLAANIKFDKNQNKIKLPTAEPPGWVSSTATGWGYENMARPRTTSKLMKVQLSTLKATECQKYLPSFTLYTEQICTYSAPGRGVCHGDSGGPLAYNNELIGIVSYGIPCGRGYPDVFSSVYHYRNWINNIVNTS